MLADVLGGRLNRRDLLARAGALGLSASFVSSLLAVMDGRTGAATAAAAPLLQDVPRERTLIVLQGGANGQNPEFANFNI